MLGPANVVPVVAAAEVAAVVIAVAAVVVAVPAFLLAVPAVVLAFADSLS